MKLHQSTNVLRPSDVSYMCWVALVGYIKHMFGDLYFILLVTSERPQTALGRLSAAYLLVLLSSSMAQHRRAPVSRISSTLWDPCKPFRVTVFPPYVPAESVDVVMRMDLDLYAGVQCWLH